MRRVLPPMMSRKATRPAELYYCVVRSRWLRQAASALLDQAVLPKTNLSLTPFFALLPLEPQQSGMLFRMETGKKDP